MQLEKIVEKINLEIVNQEEENKGSHSPRSPKNKPQMPRKVDENPDMTSSIEKQGRQKSNSIHQNFKFLSQSRREFMANLQQHNKRVKSKRVTYFVKDAEQKNSSISQFLHWFHRRKY